MRPKTLLILPLVVALCAGAHAAELAGLQSLGQTHRHVVDSAVLDHRYHVFVGLPHGYGDDPDRRYPTVYVLDGGELYPMFVSYAHYLRQGEEVPELIVVGVSYGTRDWRAGNNRSHDFTAPAADRDFWGGAPSFSEFLATELMPMIEREYAADEARRVVFGQSLGGQFALYAAQAEPGLFWGHIASNPALHRNLSFFLETRAAAGNSGSRPMLFVSSGTHDDERFRTPALAWIEHWRSQPDLPWELQTVDLAGYGHFSAAPVAFRAGLRWLFAAD